MREAGVDINRLVVLVPSGTNDQIIGELGPAAKMDGLLDEPRTLKNPKRFFRLQQVTPQGLSIQFMIGDLDLISEGHVTIRASMGYYLAWLSLKSQSDLIELYLTYLDRKVEASAQAAGLDLPRTRLALR